jgi:hypothetical protein
VGLTPEEYIAFFRGKKRRKQVGNADIGEIVDKFVSHGRREESGKGEPEASEATVCWPMVGLLG